MAIYSYEEINERVPIEEVLSLHGIYPNSKGWYSLRPEDDTPSAHIDKDRRFGNTIHDFGDSNTFNPITLTAYLRGIDVFEASQVLGEAFGLIPLNKGKSSPDTVSDWEWFKVGVHPDMASKNMSFFPEKYGEERTRAHAEKYRMSINELKRQEPAMYERIVRAKAVPFVIDLKNTYYQKIYEWYKFNKDFNLDISVDALLKNVDIAKLAEDLSRAENILKKAIKDTSIKYKVSVYNVKVDYYKVIQGKVSFEIGSDSYYEIKNSAEQDKVKPYYCLVSIDEYNKLMENGLDEMRFAAFQKGDSVNLAFLPADNERFLYRMRALRGKEIEYAQNKSAEQEVSKTQEKGEVSPLSKPDASLPNKQDVALSGKTDVVKEPNVKDTGAISY